MGVSTQVNDETMREARKAPLCQRSQLTGRHRWPAASVPYHTHNVPAASIVDDDPTNSRTHDMWFFAFTIPLAIIISTANHPRSSR